MVDYDPYSGNYTNTIVTNNTILGGFATSSEEPGATKGTNFANAIIKYASRTLQVYFIDDLYRIGIAIGPHTWFGDRYGNNVSRNGAVIGNRLSGAFSYGIAITSAVNFTVQDNVLFGNTSFIGEPGVNCSSADVVPNSGPFLVDTNITQGLNIQSDFQVVQDGNSLTCVFPPSGAELWPFGLNPSNSTNTTSSGGSSTSNTTGDAARDASGSSGKTAGIAVGVVVGGLAAVVAAWLIRKRAINRARMKKVRD